MDRDAIRRASNLGQTSGSAEAAAGAVEAAKVNAQVMCKDEDWAEALTDELQTMRRRLSQIHSDLWDLSLAEDPDVGWGETIYRLANRGADLPAASDELLTNMQNA